MDKIAEFLIERETITGKEFMQIFEEVRKQSETDTDPAQADPEEMGSADVDESLGDPVSDSTDQQAQNEDAGLDDKMPTVDIRKKTKEE